MYISSNRIIIVYAIIIFFVPAIILYLSYKLGKNKSKNIKEFKKKCIIIYIIIYLIFIVGLFFLDNIKQELTLKNNTIEKAFKFDYYKNYDLEYFTNYKNTYVTVGADTKSLKNNYYTNITCYKIKNGIYKSINNPNKNLKEIKDDFYIVKYCYNKDDDVTAIIVTSKSINVDENTTIKDKYNTKFEYATFKDETPIRYNGNYGGYIYIGFIKHKINNYYINVNNRKIVYKSNKKHKIK